MPSHTSIASCTCSKRVAPKQSATPQTALDRGDINTAVSTVLSLARRGYAGAGRAAAVLAAGGHLESREPGLATELLATALAHCPAGELPSLLDRWAAVPHGGAATLSLGITRDENNDGGDKTLIAAEGRSAGVRRPTADWLARRLRECFAQAGAGAARGLALLPQLGDAHLALAIAAALGIQPAIAALESALSDAVQLGVPARAVLLFTMYASGIQALDAAAGDAESGDAAGIGAAASSARKRLTLSPWAVLRHVQQLPEQLSADGEAAREACLDYERCMLCLVSYGKNCFLTSTAPSVRRESMPKHYGRCATSSLHTCALKLLCFMQAASADRRQAVHPAVAAVNTCGRPHQRRPGSPAGTAGGGGCCNRRQCSCRQARQLRGARAASDPVAPVRIRFQCQNLLTPCCCRAETFGIAARHALLHDDSHKNGMVTHLKSAVFIHCRYPFDLWAVTLRFVKTLLLGATSVQQVRDAAPVVQQQASRLSARPVDAVSALLDDVWPQLQGTAHRQISLCLTLITALLEVHMACSTTSPVFTSLK